MSYYFLIFALLTSIISATNHAEIIDFDPSDPDSAHSLYELTHQLIRENIEQTAFRKKIELHTLQKDLTRLETEKEKEETYKKDTENQMIVLRKKLTEAKNMQNLNTNGRNVFSLLTIGSAAITTILKGASMYAAPQISTYYYDDPCSIAFLLSISFGALAGATHYLKTSNEYSAITSEQQIGIKESSIKQAENRIFDLDTKIKELSEKINVITSTNKETKTNLYSSLLDFKKTL